MEIREMSSIGRSEIVGDRYGNRGDMFGRES
jgi:hypothetical protein